MKKMLVTVWECFRCGHDWIARREDKPIVCPKCKSPYYDREKVKQSKTNRKPIRKR